jgi:choline kinase
VTSKRVAAGLQYDTIGESVGFFRFDPAGARRLATLVAGYVESGRANMPHEEAVRDLLLQNAPQATFDNESSGSQIIIDVTDITGLPWIEIDFPNDVSRAASTVLPQLPPLP